jgi:uncharacterized protein YdaU (DUF1376 family)
MTRTPWFKFYPADYTRDGAVTEMSHAERGLYIDMLCWSWENGPLPNDHARLERIFGIVGEDFAPLWAAVRPCFEGGHELVNPRLEQERAEAEARIERAKKGGQARAKQSPSTAQAEPKQEPSTASAPLPAPVSGSGSGSGSESGSESEKNQTRARARSSSGGKRGPEREPWVEVALRAEYKALTASPYREAWHRWRDHCVDRHTAAKLPTATRAAAIFNSHLSDIPLAIKAIDAAIRNDWKGPELRYVQDRKRSEAPRAQVNGAGESWADRKARIAREEAK